MPGSSARRLPTAWRSRGARRCCSIGPIRKREQRDGGLVCGGDCARADAARLVRSEQSGDGGLPALGLEAGAGALVSRRGESRLVRRSRESGRVAEQVQRLRDWGYAAEMLPAARCLEDLEPGLTFPDPGTPVAWFPDEAWVDPRALTQRLVEGGAQRRRPRADGVGAGGRRHRHRGGRVSSLTLRAVNRFLLPPSSTPPVWTPVTCGAGGRLAGAGAAQSCRARGAAGRRRSPTPPGPNRRYRRPT